jgi:hypothetical protein
VSSFGSARVHGTARSAAVVAAAIALSLIASATTMNSAAAQEIHTGGCIASWGAFSCADLWATPSDPFLRLAPQPTTPEAQAGAKSRDRRWVERCRPTIRQDRYGVARYTYAMPGCDFGFGEY